MSITRRQFLMIAAAIAAAAGQATGWSASPPATAPWPPPGFGAVPVPPRAPKYPLKTARTLRSDTEIAYAKANVAKYPAAKAVANKTLQGAGPWLRWDDEDLLFLQTPARIPRAFEANSAIGCPKCGKEIYKFGTYPWIVDPKKPFKLTCPVDGSVYPSNDYEAYYRSGFKDKIGWDTEFVDDGWGWVSPSGDRSWFVAHANHQVWKNHVQPAVLLLAQSYQLTGDLRYAHKAAVILYGIAQVYPEMDYMRQSDFGIKMAAVGQVYAGKVLNRIWETTFAQDAAQSYDAVWETLDGDTELQKLTGKTGPDIRAFFEANFLDDAVDAYYDGKILGNYGMHQSALCNIAIARQYGEQDKWLGGIIDFVSSNPSYEGLRYALYDLIYPEGIPSETSPSYNFLWVSCITQMAVLLGRSGRDLFALPRMRSLYDGVLDVINVGKFTPALGDSGSFQGAVEGRNADVFQAAYRAYHDERYAAFLASFGAAGDGGFQTYDSLFQPPIEAKSPTLPALPARLLDGVGLGILSNPQDTVSTTLTYGLKAGHGHYDRLSFELFANGQPMMPDLGYPDAMNAYIAGIYTWSKNTVSHNTVVVDASRQMGNVHGTVKHFASSDFARALDVDAAGTYPQTTEYRRGLLMVDYDDTQSYYLDVFDVAGGKQHDYSLHGPHGEFEMIGGNWSSPEQGTLAGVNVAVGELYDDPAKAAPGYKGGYDTYTGSGFQHLVDVQRGGGGDWVAQWRHSKDPDAGLRIRTLPQPGQEMILADARVSPINHPELIKFLIARRTGDSGLKSRFISVIEPFRGQPLLTSVQALNLTEGSGIALLAKRADGMSDLLIYDPERTLKRLPSAAGEIVTDAQAAVVALGASGKVTRVFFTGGTSFAIGLKIYGGQPHLEASVASVDPEKGVIIVDTAPGAVLIATELEGRVVYFSDARGGTWHTIKTALVVGPNRLQLSVKEDLRIACVPVKSIGSDRLTVTSEVSLPLAQSYTGASLAGRSFERYILLAGASESVLTLAESIPTGGDIIEGEDAWLVSIAPGSVMTVPQVSTQSMS
jgi:hypothetical protein